MSSIWLVKWRLQRVICVREGASFFRSEMFDQDYWYVTLGCHYEIDMLSAKPTNCFNQLRIEEDIWKPKSLASAAVKFRRFTVHWEDIMW